MMQVDHETMGAPSGMGGAVRAAINALGAAVSVGLILAVGVWGYKLAMRDVSGVPVVRALEGPMRVAPEEPGGMQAAHQGLSVNAVAAGAPAPRPEQLRLAPQPPGLEVAQLAPAPVMAEPAVLRRDLPDGSAGAFAAEAGTDPGAFAALEDLPAEPEETHAVALAGEVLPETVPGIARSPLPRARPAGDMLAETAARAVLAALSPGAAVEVDPDSITPGMRLVQLGAYDDAEAARAEWAALTDRFGALMEGKGRVIQSAEAGGRTFYRLRVQGFGDEPEARRFCAVLIAENMTCIPVLIR
jgi:hypothetical protein